MIGYSLAPCSRLTQMIRRTRELVATVLIAARGTMTSGGTGQAPFVKVCVAPFRFIRRRNHTERAISVNDLELLVAHSSSFLYSTSAARFLATNRGQNMKAKIHFREIVHANWQSGLTSITKRSEYNHDALESLS